MSNAASLLADSSVRTCSCKFDNSDATYTYVTRQDLKVGDKVAVTARGRSAIVTVTHVPAKVPIDPYAPFDYKFVESKPIEFVTE